MPSDGTARDHPGRRHPLAIALAISIVGAIVYLIWAPQTLDLAAQTFRADLWERDGFVIWSPAWYSGLTVPGYSLLYPPLGALVGPVLLGSLCAVASTWLFASIVLRAVGEDGWLAVIWFGAASLVAPFGGRTTFALGLVVGLAAIWLLQRRQGGLASVTAIATSLASPVAGLFGGLAAAAVVLANYRRLSEGEPPPMRDGVAALAGFALGLAVPVLAFPTGGFQPFAFSAYIWIPLAVAAIFALGRGGGGVLRWGAILYLLLATFAVIIETPVGGNATRLGLTFAGPLLAILVVRYPPDLQSLRRPLVLALLAIPLIYWQWTATVRDLVAAEGDRSTQASFYAPLLSEFERLGVNDGDRVHIPPTRNRWESVYVAEAVPITRGWLRQLEATDIELFTEGELTPDGYARWLTDNGAGWVAIPEADRDYLATDEVGLIYAGLSYLGPPVWSNPDWDLYRLRVGPGTGLESASSDRAIGVAGPDPKIRWSPYLEVEGAAGSCILSDGRWTRVEPKSQGTATPGGEINLRAGLSPSAILGRDRSCDDGS